MWSRVVVIWSNFEAGAVENLDFDQERLIVNRDFVVMWSNLEADAVEM
jgi:hypothetical protein